VSDRYAVEVLLRPPVELYSATVSGIAAVLCLKAPHIFMMPQAVAYVAAACLVLLSCIRARQGFRIISYQRNLRRTRRYSIKAKQIPVSNKRLFLGRGFRWTQKNTERLYAARDNHARRYIEPGTLELWIRRLEAAWEHAPVLNRIARLMAADSPLNPFRPPPGTGGDPVLHGVGYEDERDAFMQLAERSGHLVVVAKTRHGKTRLAEILTTQDIRRGNNVVIVLDPKGDADYLKRVYVEAMKARREFITVHLGYPEFSARYNALGSFSRITEVASKTTGPLPAEGEASAFKEFSWLFVNVISVALVALGEQPDLIKIRRYISDIDPLLVRYARHWLSENGPPGWQEALGGIQSKLTGRKLSRSEEGREPEAVAIVRYIKDNDLFDPVLEGLTSAFRYEREYFQKITVAIKPFLEKLTTGKIAEIIAPNLSDLDDDRPVLDWGEAIRKRAVVYIGLDALTDPEVAHAFGEWCFADLTSYAGQIYKHGTEYGLPEIGIKEKLPDIIIHGDEFSDLLGPKFKTLINKSGGAGYQLNLYTQTWSDPVAELGSEAKAAQIAGNIGTWIMMGVKEEKTCEMLTKQLPEVNVSQITAVSAATDSGDLSEGIRFVSQNQDRISISLVPMISPADIVALPKGQAFAVLNGSELWKIRIPMPAKIDDDELPSDLAAMLRQMKRDYSSIMDYGYTDSVNWRALQG
jgi:conjugative coupling factor TraD (TOL family)